MVNLDVIFQQLYEGVVGGNPRYEIIDGEHVMDNDLRVKYHIYADYKNKPYAISEGDVVLLTGVQMTEGEADILMRLSKIIGTRHAENQRSKFYERVYGIPPQAPSTEVPLRQAL